MAAITLPLSRSPSLPLRSEFVIYDSRRSASSPYRPRKYSSGAPSPSAISLTSPTKMVWSPAECAPTVTQSRLARASFSTGMPLFMGRIFNAQPISRVRIALRIGKKLRQRFLLLLQHAHSKLAAVPQMQVSLGQVIDANQHQRRMQRH